MFIMNLESDGERLDVHVVQMPHHVLILNQMHRATAFTISVHFCCSSAWRAGPALIHRAPLAIADMTPSRARC